MVRYIICSTLFFASFITANILFILDMKTLSSKCASFVYGQSNDAEPTENKLLTKTYTRSAIFMCIKLACSLGICIIACVLDGLYSRKELLICLIFVAVFSFMFFLIPIMWLLKSVTIRYKVKLSKYTYLNPSIMCAEIAAILYAFLFALTVYEVWLLII